ncbi:MAG: chloride channel protein, partial [Bacteroidetes bacterium]|nr:chloride channel protein [Bacteroidota bacterium]
MNVRQLNFFEKGIDWIHDKLNEKQFLLFSSILVGLSAGLAAVILKFFVHAIRHYLMEEHLFRFEYKYLYLIMPLIGILLTVFIIHRFFKGNINKGADNIMFAI